MVDDISVFEEITRKAYKFTSRSSFEVNELHPFEGHNIHDLLPNSVRNLFDDGHYSHATFEAFKYIDKEVSRISSKNDSGYKLMMAAFNEQNPLIKLNDLTTTSEVDEQLGFKFLFAGGMSGIRNPRGHEYGVRDDVETCLSHLSFGSMLLRRLEEAGAKLSKST
jgi:uncharacterized protein (TIGR02391 family)